LTSGRNEPAGAEHVQSSLAGLPDRGWSGAFGIQYFRGTLFVDLKGASPARTTAALAAGEPFGIPPVRIFQH